MREKRTSVIAQRLLNVNLRRTLIITVPSSCMGGGVFTFVPSLGTCLLGAFIHTHSQITRLDEHYTTNQFATNNLMCVCMCMHFDPKTHLN